MQADTALCLKQADGGTLRNSVCLIGVLQLKLTLLSLCQNATEFLYFLIFREQIQQNSAVVEGQVIFYGSLPTG